MSLIEKLKTMVGSGEEKKYSYKCSDCGVTFESTAVNPNQTDCPECESSRTRTTT